MVLRSQMTQTLCRTPRDLLATLHCHPSSFFDHNFNKLECLSVCFPAPSRLESVDEQNGAAGGTSHRHREERKRQKNSGHTRTRSSEVSKG